MTSRSPRAWNRVSRPLRAGGGGLSADTVAVENQGDEVCNRRQPAGIAAAQDETRRSVYWWQPLDAELDEGTGLQLRGHRLARNERNAIAAAYGGPNGLVAVQLHGDARVDPGSLECSVHLCPEPRWSLEND